MAKKSDSYFDILNAAINDMSEHGYDSAERVVYWSQRIKDAGEKTMKSSAEMERMLREAMAAVYKRLIEKEQIISLHPGVSRFTLERIRPQLRAELDRRIMASAGLIKLNRQQAIEKTLQRFAGWATSIPKGGSRAVDKRDTKKDIRKSLVQLPFEERRVLIDQGHKLSASLSEILAKDTNAIAMVWKSHWRESGYDYREDHKERDGVCYAMRGAWAIDKGLMRAGGAGYYDEITSVGEEPFCRCFAKWIYNLRDVPADMLTKKGAAELERVRAQIKAMA